MTAGKHTPGPWMLIEIGDEVPKFALADATALSLLTVVHEGRVPFAAIYSDADARLIAAAPDMLEALQFCLGQDLSPEAIRMVRAAISKAKGEP